MGTNMGTSMAKQSLTDRKLKSTNLAVGRHYNGGGNGLHLLVRKSGSKGWVQRIRVHGKYVDLGLGSYPAVSLGRARQIAFENKSIAAGGKDPRLVTTKPQKVLTFSEVADAVVAMKAKELSNAKHRAQWASTLDTYAKHASRRLLSSFAHCLRLEIEIKSSSPSDHVSDVDMARWALQPNHALSGMYHLPSWGFALCLAFSKPIQVSPELRTIRPAGTIWELLGDLDQYDNSIHELP